ncbi:hypothetical protein ES703_115939 [subsurface metagenome]
MSRIRGIKEIIKAMEFIGDKAELWLLGKWENKEFERKCEELKGWQYTKYLGLLPLSKVYRYTKAADVGISILYPTENYVTSLPIKAFEYMACNLPMVMSNFPYWRRIFEKCTLFAISGVAATTLVKTATPICSIMWTIEATHFLIHVLPIHSLHRICWGTSS